MANRVQPESPAPIETEPIRSSCGNWTLCEYPIVSSTNVVAAGLPAWNAVRADTQTNGRGRFQRTWISDDGGLWLSAVVPLDSEAITRRVLPLAAGLAICDVLQAQGISNFRMRWPNDVLVNDRKLAGLLIDEFSPGLAVVGIGMNVHNRPEAKDARLTNLTTRLADLMPQSPALPVLAALVLRQLASVLGALKSRGFAYFFVRVNRLWGQPRKLELDLDGTIQQGLFQGVDSEGRLVLADPSGQLAFYEAHRVRHLTEI